MSCEQFRDLMPDVILDPDDAEKRNALERHLGECGNCRTEYDAMLAAADMLRPEPGSGLLPEETLRMKNRIRRNSPVRFPRRGSAIVFRRLAAVAAALFFFLLGFFARDLYRNNAPVERTASIKPAIEMSIVEKLSNASGQRLSPRGFLLIARGRKAFEEYELGKQIP